jgi:hypothetical protein
MHDTPPPTKLGDGSFNAELQKEVAFQNSGGRWQHRFVPEGKAPFLAHIRVLKGNGETIYFDESAEYSVITIELQDDDNRKVNVGDLTITGGDAYFQIDSDSRLGGPHPGAKGRHKYLHPGKGNSFHISRIAVEKPAGSSQFEVRAPVDRPEEYVVMIWHQGD